MKPKLNWHHSRRHQETSDKGRALSPEWFYLMRPIATCQKIQDNTGIFIHRLQNTEDTVCKNRSCLATNNLSNTDFLIVLKLNSAVAYLHFTWQEVMKRYSSITGREKVSRFKLCNQL